MKRLLASTLLAACLTLPVLAQTPHWTLTHRATVETSLKRKGAPRDRASEPGGLPARRTCHTMMHDSTLRQRYPALGSLEQFERSLEAAMSERRASGLMSEDVYRIPVIFHVVHNGEAVGQGTNLSAAQIASQIEVLNEDYRMKASTPGHNSHPKGADVGIEFVLAVYDVDGRPLAEPGIRRVRGGRSTWTYDAIESELKPQTQWDPEMYLNIWSLKFDAKEQLLGYAQFPNLSGLEGLEPNMGGASTDGVVINYQALGRAGSAGAPYDRGRTATHEVGHWLGLRHIWGDGDCSVDDFCDDTPESGAANYECDVTINTCNAPERNMVENYMDYTNDACMNIFTACQRERMRTVLERSPRRKGLITSGSGTPTARPIARFDADRQTGCEGVTITFNDRSTNAPTSWRWTFFVDGEFSAEFVDQNPTLTFPGASLWDVQLVATNGSGSDTLYIPNFLTVISDDETVVPFDVDFENGSLLTNWTMFNPDDDRGWILDDGVSAYGEGTMSAAFDNYSTDTDPSGTIDAMMSAPIDLATHRHASVAFDVAYAPYEDENERLDDTLALFYSTDCGENWTPFWWKGGGDLATAESTEEMFVPAGDEWRGESISLGFLNGQTVHLALANVSNWGNVVYVDNVRIAVEESDEPTVADFYAAESEICQGESVAFSDASEGAPRSWSWTFPGGRPSTSQLQHPHVAYDAPGTYRVTLQVSGENGSDSYTIDDYVVVSERPSVTASASKTSISKGESVTLSASGAGTYFWSNGRDNETVMAPSIRVSPVATTTYRVTGFVDDGCPGESSITITVEDGPTSVEMPVGGTTPMTLLPNPATDGVTLDMDVPAGTTALTIAVIDMSGRLVLSLEEPANAGRFTRRLDVAHLPAGTYAVRVATGRGTSMIRFVKQ